jgi:hypothetical protein
MKGDIRKFSQIWGIETRAGRHEARRIRSVVGEHAHDGMVEMLRAAVGRGVSVTVARVGSETWLMTAECKTLGHRKSRGCGAGEFRLHSRRHRRHTYPAVTSTRSKRLTLYILPTMVYRYIHPQHFSCTLLEEKFQKSRGRFSWK